MLRFLGAGLFIGLATLDVVGYVDRRPDADEKVEAVDVWTGAGGPAANAAIAFCALGGPARLLTALGSDPAARIASEDIERHGVDVVDLYTGGAFPVSLVTVDGSGRRSVVSKNAADLDRRQLTEDDLSGSVLVFDRHGFELVEDCALPREEVTVVADLGNYNERSSSILRFADVTVVPASGLPEAEREHPANFVRQSGGSRFVVTRGAEPIIVCDGDETVHIPVPRVPVVDTLGAGDIFVGALAFYLDRRSLSEAVFLASAQASRSCTYRSARLNLLG
jgi:sugar/nucleoside kinase (ribokinase family)